MNLRIRFVNQVFAFPCETLRQACYRGNARALESCPVRQNNRRFHLPFGDFPVLPEQLFLLLLGHEPIAVLFVEPDCPDGGLPGAH